jgi:hypothetical protein
MRRMKTIVTAAALLLGLSAGASGFSGEIVGLSVAMGHVNELIDGYNADADVELATLRAGVGVEVAGDLAIVGSAITLGAGGRGLLARTTKRDVSLTASLVGLFARGAYAAGPWRASADVGAYFGSLSFPSARLVGLRGLGVGLAGRIGYVLPVTSALGFDIHVGLEWLPVQEMTDSAGQKYRGRGTPFMDFSGLSASIGVIW